METKLQWWCCLKCKVSLSNILWEERLSGRSFFVSYPNFLQSFHNIPLRFGLIFFNTALYTRRKMNSYLCTRWRSWVIKSMHTQEYCSRYSCPCCCVLWFMCTKKQQKAPPHVMLVSTTCSIIAIWLICIMAPTIVCFANFFLHHLLVE